MAVGRSAYEPIGTCKSKQINESCGLFANRAVERSCVIDANPLSGPNALVSQPLPQSDSGGWRIEWTPVQRCCCN